MGAKAPQPAPPASTKPSPSNAVPPRGGSGLMPPPPPAGESTANLHELLGDELRESAADDPCLPVRNLAGHIVTCNYGDWADFSKCKCSEGLLGAPEQKTAFVVAPMPLRDILASSIQVSDEMAHELAIGIRKARKQDSKIETVGQVLGVSNEPPLTIIELADARAKIRYLEADAMIVWRAQSLKINAEAARETDPQPGRLCGCGHGVHAHDQNNSGGLLGCARCGCMLWDEGDEPEPSRIVIPEFP